MVTQGTIIRKFEAVMAVTAVTTDAALECRRVAAVWLR
jgi:hypothetical protein